MLLLPARDRCLEHLIQLSPLTAQNRRGVRRYRDFAERHIRVRVIGTTPLVQHAWNLLRIRTEGSDSSALDAHKIESDCVAWLGRSHAVHHCWLEGALCVQNKSQQRV